MLSDKARSILFWFTIGMILLVAAVAVVTILRACGGVISPEESPMAISPEEITVCTGEEHQFVAEGGTDLTWRVTGGTISESGAFSAGDDPGNYIVTAIQDKPRRVAEAIVHVVACTPEPTSTPSPIPSPTPSPLPVPTATPTTEAPTPPPADSQGDVGTYESGAPVEGAPAGVDIRTASVGTDLRVDLQPSAGVPEELAGWVNEGEILLWITVYEPIPEPPVVYTDWLFALDLDGDTATGRPAGASRINPDLGTEAAIGVSYNPASGQFEPYFWIWDSAEGEWAVGPEAARVYVGEARTLVGLALSLDTLTQNVAQIAGVTIVPEAVQGRAAALSYVGEQGVIDFYPDRPE